MKIKNRFYVGSRSIVFGGRTEWAHPTLEKAISHAKELVEETDAEQIVVQIIRVIKRKDSPITVEKV